MDKLKRRMIATTGVNTDYLVIENIVNQADTVDAVEVVGEVRRL